jgi:molybdopterin molybdotransferase
MQLPIQQMISVSEARERIAAHTIRRPVAFVKIDDAAGLMLAEDLYSVIDIPAYPQSSMDGYAIRFADYHPGEGLLLSQGDSAAGTRERYELESGHAKRIFTGAAVPDGADTIVMQEKCTVSEGRLFIDDASLKQGQNLRLKGSEIRRGELALATGSRLHPATIGFLSMIGVTHVNVFEPPKVCIIVTGNELVDPGGPLGYGQVYESNSHALRAALAQMSIREIAVVHAQDNLEALTHTLAAALDNYDMILLNGGISVGEYDFVLRATEQCGIQQVFHKIRQKPGKPMYFGTSGDKLIFGLPGNPASVLTCFYEYVAVCLEKLYGVDPGIRSIQAPLGADVKKPAGLTHFLKGYFDGVNAHPLDAQESYRLSSFARANALIVIEEEKTQCVKGEMVELHLLPV